MDNPRHCFSSLESITRNGISGSYRSSLFHWLQNQSPNSKVAVASFTFSRAGDKFFTTSSPILVMEMLNCKGEVKKEGSGRGQWGREEDKAGEGT